MCGRGFSGPGRGTHPVARKSPVGTWEAGHGPRKADWKVGDVSSRPKALPAAAPAVHSPRRWPDGRQGARR